MLKSSRLEEYKNIEKKTIIKDVRSPFRLKKLKEETNDAAIEAIRNLFWLKKENKSIKVRISTDIGIVLSMRKRLLETSKSK